MQLQAIKLISSFSFMVTVHWQVTLADSEPGPGFKFPLRLRVTCEGGAQRAGPDQS